MQQALPFSVPAENQWVGTLIAERLVAGVVLVVLSPVLVLLAVITKVTSPGPVLFTQRRMGKDGKPFVIYKFRTLKTGCKGPLRVLKGDERVTSWGRFARRYRLDELPQLWNVLQGEMRFVGPRPIRLEHYAEVERFIPHYRNCTIVLPGITGLAQVTMERDGSETGWRRSYSLDMECIRSRSFGQSLGIIIRTVWVVVKGGGY